MRIHEITESELVQPTVTDHEYEPSTYTRAQAKKKKIPHGSFAYADLDDDNPHEVSVKNFKAIEGDPKEAFYTAMSDLIGSNPYMPVIYNIDRFKQNDASRNEYNTERLLDHGAVPAERMVSAVEFFINDVELDEHHTVTQALESVKSLLNHNPRKLSIKRRLVQLHTVVAKTIQTYLYSPSSMPESSQLYQFVQVFYQLLRTGTAGSLDLHPDNLMYRPTQYGAQLVIADPLFNPDHY